jgi:hypothetical protein
MHTGHDARTQAIIEQARKRSEVIKTETLPPEVRMVIDQMLATIKDHEVRLAQTEGFQSALVCEATNKLKGAA